MYPTKPHQKFKAPFKKYKRPHPITLILILFALLALAHFIATMHTKTQPSMNADSCYTLLHHTDYTKIISLRPTQEMAAVQFLDDAPGKHPGALIQVRDNDAQQHLDTSIYGCSMHNHHPSLQLDLQQQGLVQGTVTMSQNQILSIAQLDTILPPNNDAFLLPLQQNVYQEYTWHNGTLNRITFPGLYPVTSWVEAETLQNEAMTNTMAPWNDPLATAEQMAHDLLHWSEKSFQGTLKDANATDAHVLLQTRDTHLQVIVSLARLIQHDNQGLWFVTGAQSQGITLDQTQFAHPQASPITVQGTTFPSQHTIQATLFDHTLNPIHTLHAPIFTIDANGNFTGTISYSHIFPDQTGLLLLQENVPAGNKDQSSLLLTSILLG